MYIYVYVYIVLDVADIERAEERVARLVEHFLLEKAVDGTEVVSKLEVEISKLYTGVKHEDPRYHQQMCEEWKAVMNKNQSLVFLLEQRTDLFTVSKSKMRPPQHAARVGGTLSKVRTQ